MRTKLGGLHIDHARRLAASIDPADEWTVIAALLHDVLEKTSMTVDEMRDVVPDPRVVQETAHVPARPGPGNALPRTT